MKCKEIWIFWLLYKSNSRNLLFKSDMKLRNATCVLFNTLFQLKNLLIRHVDKLPLRKICLTQFETRIYWRLSKITGKLYFKKLSNTASRCALSLYFWIILFMILLKGSPHENWCRIFLHLSRVNIRIIDIIRTPMFLW